MKQLEKNIESKLRDKIKQLGGRAYKFVSPGNAGVMDRLVVLPGGKVYFVETKRPGGRTRTLQNRQIAFLQKLGFEVLVISNEIELENFIKKIRGDKDGKTNI